MTEPFRSTLASVIRHAVDERLADLRVAMPGRVERVDLAQGLVDAKPLVQDRVAIEGATRVLPFEVITNVPIMWPSGAWGGITFPIAVGDTVLLVFSDRSLDVWLAGGGEVDPVGPRQHALSDAMAIPGLRPFSAARATAADPAWALVGKDGGPWQPAGCGQSIRDELDALWAALKAHGHDLMGVAPGSATVACTATTGALPVAQTGSGTPVADDKKPVRSTTVKVSE